MKASWSNEQVHVGKYVATTVTLADAANLDSERRRGAIDVPGTGIPCRCPRRDESGFAFADDIQRHVCG
jgi:hypothetical protein